MVAEMRPPYALQAPYYRLHRLEASLPDHASMPPHLPSWNGHLLDEVSRFIDHPLLPPPLLPGPTGMVAGMVYAPAAKALALGELDQSRHRASFNFRLQPPPYLTSWRQRWSAPLDAGHRVPSTRQGGSIRDGIQEVTRWKEVAQRPRTRRVPARRETMIATNGSQFPALADLSPHGKRCHRCVTPSAPVTGDPQDQQDLILER